MLITIKKTAVAYNKHFKTKVHFLSTVAPEASTAPATAKRTWSPARRKAQELVREKKREQAATSQAVAEKKSWSDARREAQKLVRERKSLPLEEKQPRKKPGRWSPARRRAQAWSQQKKELDLIWTYGDTEDRDLVPEGTFSPARRAYVKSICRLNAKISAQKLKTPSDQVPRVVWTLARLEGYNFLQRKKRSARLNKRRPESTIFTRKPTWYYLSGAELKSLAAQWNKDLLIPKKIFWAEVPDNSRFKVRAPSERGFAFFKKYKNSEPAETGSFSRKNFWRLKEAVRQSRAARKELFKEYQALLFPTLPENLKGPESYKPADQITREAEEARIENAKYIKEAILEFQPTAEALRLQVEAFVAEEEGYQTTDNLDEEATSLQQVDEYSYADSYRRAMRPQQRERLLAKRHWYRVARTITLVNEYRLDQKKALSPTAYTREVRIRKLRRSRYAAAFRRGILRGPLLVCNELTHAEHHTNLVLEDHADLLDQIKELAGEVEEDAGLVARANQRVFTISGEVIYEEALHLLELNWLTAGLRIAIIKELRGPYVPRPKVWSGQIPPFQTIQDSPAEPSATRLQKYYCYDHLGREVEIKKLFDDIINGFIFVCNSNGTAEGLSAHHKVHILRGLRCLSEYFEWSCWEDREELEWQLWACTNWLLFKDDYGVWIDYEEPEWNSEFLQEMIFTLFWCREKSIAAKEVFYDKKEVTKPVTAVFYVAQPEAKVASFYLAGDKQEPAATDLEYTEIKKQEIWSAKVHKKPKAKGPKKLPEELLEHVLAFDKVRLVRRGPVVGAGELDEDDYREDIMQWVWGRTHTLPGWNRESVLKKRKNERLKDAALRRLKNRSERLRLKRALKKVHRQGGSEQPEEVDEEDPTIANRKQFNKLRNILKNEWAAHDAGIELTGNESFYEDDENDNKDDF